MESGKYKDFLVEIFFEISQSSSFIWSNIKDFPEHLVTINFHTDPESCNSIIINKIPGNNSDETKYVYRYENSCRLMSRNKEEYVAIDQEKCKDLILWFLSEYGIPNSYNWRYHPYP